MQLLFPACVEPDHLPAPCQMQELRRCYESYLTFVNWDMTPICPLCEDGLVVVAVDGIEKIRTPVPCTSISFPARAHTLRTRRPYYF